jgi:hypothetical protein
MGSQLAPVMAMRDVPPGPGLAMHGQHPSGIVDIYLDVGWRGAMRSTRSPLS